MNIVTIVTIFVILGGLTIPSAFSQSVDHVVINEVDINPPGDDSKSVTEWVELYNPTDSPIDIGGWKIASTTILKKTMTISPGTVIGPGKFLTFSYQTLWFPDVNEIVQLRNSAGFVVDQTPQITDMDNTFTSWQRIYDGFDTDSISDWIFAVSTAGSTNGKLALDVDDDKLSASITTNKESFVFGETVTISGTVSERVFIEKPTFQAEQIHITVTGPKYFKVINLFPDLNLKYKTSMNLQKVLGFSEGTYTVAVNYAGATSQTQFSIGQAVTETKIIEVGNLLVTTDKASYIPGKTVTIIGASSEVIPYEGLKFKVINPNGIQIYQGTLFPNTLGTLASVRGGQLSIDSKAQFAAEIFMDTVKPVYGLHKITAQYGQYSAEGSFMLQEDIKEDKIVSLTTDKPVYGLGETVVISGRLNNLWVFAMDLEIRQTGQSSLAINPTNVLSINNSVRLEGDSTFSYEFKIPNSSDRYGDYRVKVSKSVGEGITTFKVVENPGNYIQEEILPFSVTTDKKTYNSGDKIVYSGRVAEPFVTSSFQSPNVQILVTKDGEKIISSTFKPSGNKPLTVAYSLTAIPDIIGNYKVEDTLYGSVFTPGRYLVSATYGGTIYKAIAEFTIVDPLTESGISISLDKQIYGLDETVTVTGTIPGTSQGSGVTLTVTKPNGETDKSGQLLDNSKFTWTWKTPRAEKAQLKSTLDRSVFISNYGIYKLNVAYDSINRDFLFKVSPNPADDFISVIPIDVNTDKATYVAGEKLLVFGNVLKTGQVKDGFVSLEPVKITIKSMTNKLFYEATVNPNQGGSYQSVFDLPITLFTEGTYKVTSIQGAKRAQTLFTVTNDLQLGVEEKIRLLVGTNAETYSTGDIVEITGRTNKLIYLDKVHIDILKKSDQSITCGSFICGTSAVSTIVTPSSSGSFNYNYQIPTKDLAKGTYEVIASAEFGKFSALFVVAEKQTMIEPEAKPVSKLTEKFNRISESFVSIETAQKQVDGNDLSPRVIQGSLITTERGEESNVNLKVHSAEGTCIIGQEIGCMVKESTRKQGAIYEIITISGIDYKIRYSGPDVRLEKFTILPDSDDGVLPDASWSVDVIKQDQPSRLYYKITYVPTQ